MDYQKPKVTKPAYSPEPVESGCCLTSCGGSPAQLLGGRHNTDETRKTLKLLKPEAPPIDDEHENPQP